MRGTRPSDDAEFMAPPARGNASLPSSVDWRKPQPYAALTPVKNQGGCGSCWAFAAVETLESRLAIATKQDAPILSPQQIVSCAPNPDDCGGTGGCQGSTEELAFSYTKGAGITSEASYAYKGTTGKCDTSKIKAVAHNSGYQKIATNDYNGLMSAVVEGPVAITVAAGGFGWQLYGGGVYHGNCGYDLDHGVQLVGYGSDKGTDYWIVRNSWGAGWGEHGFIRLQRFGDGKEPFGVDTAPGDGIACKGDKSQKTYCGMCGILADTSYPTGLTKA